MNTARTVTRRVVFQRRRKGQKSLRPGEQPQSAPSQSVPRVSRLMALALRFERLIADGHVKDQAELAAMGHVTTAPGFADHELAPAGAIHPGGDPLPRSSKRRARCGERARTSVYSGVRRLESPKNGLVAAAGRRATEAVMIRFARHRQAPTLA